MRFLDVLQASRPNLFKWLDWAAPFLVFKALGMYNFATMLSRKVKRCWKLWSNFDTSTERAKQKVRKMCIQRRFALPNLNDMMLATANCPVLRLSKTAPASDQSWWEILADFNSHKKYLVNYPIKSASHRFCWGFSLLTNTPCFKD